MQKFRDKTGREWSIDLDVAVVDQLEADAGVSVYALAEKHFAPLFELVGNPRRLVAVLFVLCRDQIAAVFPDLTEDARPKAFSGCFTGDSIESAGLALLEAVLDFFPNRAVRNAMRKAIGKLTQLTDEAGTRAEIEIEALTLDSLPGDSAATSGSGPASSESTPGATGTDSSP